MGSRAMRVAPWPGTATAHHEHRDSITLRHGFATHMLESGVDIFAIKSLLGHASIQSTVRYLDFVPNRHQNLISPLDRLAL